MGKSRDGTRIAYQNKDISSKSFGENLRGDALEVYGVMVPKIVEVKPTNLPAVEANELRMDNLFLLEDGSLAIVDYESRYSEENKGKYLGYVARLAGRIYNEYGEYRKLRIIVIYTADVTRGSTKSSLDMGGARLEIEEGFLSDLDPKEIRDRIDGMLTRGEPLTDRDIMELVIYPLTHKGREAQKRAVREAIEIADRITDEKQRRIAASGLLVFTDKIISKEDEEEIIRRLSMTKIEKYYEDRQDKAVKAAVKQAEDKTWKEARKEARKEAKKEKKESAIRLLMTGDSIDKVAECLGLTKREVQGLAAKI